MEGYLPFSPTLFRINYTFPNATLLDYAMNPKIHDIAISDHAPISVELEGFTARNSAKIWHFPSYLAHNQTLQNIVTEMWTEYLYTNSQHNVNPNLLWDAGKAMLLGKIISYSSCHKKRITLTLYIEVSK